MNTFGIFGFMFGMVGFTLATVAMRKVKKLEEELKRQKVLGENFSSDR